MTEWLNQHVGEAIAPYAAIAIGLFVVLILIALLFRLLKAFGGNSFIRRNQSRLGITEAVALEGKRRIVLIRRDNVEHLIMIGGENDVVIEQGIERPSIQPQMAKPSKKAAPAQTEPSVAPTVAPVAQPRSEPTVQKAAPASAASVQPVTTAANPTVKPQTQNDSAKVKEMDRLFDQIAGD